MMVIQDAKAGHNAGAFGICLSSIGAYVDPDTPSNAAPGAFQRCKRAARHARQGPPAHRGEPAAGRDPALRLRPDPDAAHAA
jgi:hypothetical protein